MGNNDEEGNNDGVCLEREKDCFIILLHKHLVSLLYSLSFSLGFHMERELSEKRKGEIERESSME